ncbi:family 43 glycosylhydrolase, partial [Angustibacter aerolatus]
MRRSARPAARRTALAALLATGLAVPAAQAATPADRTQPATYRNPVSQGFADTFADPSLLRGKDGWWYAVGTSDPLREGEGTPHQIPIARSRDLVSWTHVGDAFTAATRPAWATADAGLWAPDLRYVDGEYRMYYVVTDTTVTPESGDNAIGVATAPTPAGPWTDSGAPVVAPRHGAGGSGDFLWTFDPNVVTDADGTQWLMYGSYYGGIFVVRLSADGRSTVGTATRIAIDNKFEGAYAVHRGGYWYLFASTANCCAGPTTGYSVQVGRSRSVQGPYVDRDGVPLDTSRAGGTPTLVQNGNRWIGAGHNAVVTDLGGQDWIAYHAIDRGDPYLDGTDGINERPMLLDRLDWVDGWPQVRAGRGPSERPVTAPRTGGATRVLTDGTGGTGWRLGGGWTRGSDEQAGAH